MKQAVADPANAGKSNRALAEEIGVSFESVRRARKATDTNVSVGKRTGRDGKARRPPQRRTSHGSFGLHGQGEL